MNPTTKIKFLKSYDQYEKDQIVLFGLFEPTLARRLVEDGTAKVIEPKISDATKLAIEIENQTAALANERDIIYNLAVDENRETTKEELARLDKINEEIEKLAATLKK